MALKHQMEKNHSIRPAKHATPSSPDRRDQENDGAGGVGSGPSKVWTFRAWLLRSSWHAAGWWKLSLPARNW